MGTKTKKRAAPSRHVPRCALEKALRESAGGQERIPCPDWIDDTKEVAVHKALIPLMGLLWDAGFDVVEVVEQYGRGEVCLQFFGDVWATMLMDAAPNDYPVVAQPVRYKGEVEGEDKHYIHILMYVPVKDIPMLIGRVAVTYSEQIKERREWAKKYPE